MSVVFAVESFDQVRDEIEPLLNDQHGAMRRYEDIPLDPNYAIYKAGSDAGLMLILTARQNGDLVGYALYWIAKNPNHKTVTWANSGPIWLKPSARLPRVGNRLLDFAEQTLRARGVVIMDTDTRHAHPSIRRLLEGRGHEVVNITMSKRLT